MAKGGRRTQAERAAGTREALVAAARPLFASLGFADASLETIVRNAGVTRGALYHHFATRQSYSRRCSSRWRGRWPPEWETPSRRRGTAIPSRSCGCAPPCG